MKPDVASRHHARMQRVLTYIDEHLDDELDVDLPSGIAAFPVTICGPAVQFFYADWLPRTRIRTARPSDFCAARQPLS